MISIQTTNVGPEEFIKNKSNVDIGNDTLERESSIVTMNCQHVRHETCNCFEIAPPSKPEKDKVMLNQPSLNENADVPTCTFARAMDVMRNNNISYDTKCGVFIIKQPKEEARIVPLFPKLNIRAYLQANVSIY